MMLLISNRVLVHAVILIPCYENGQTPFEVWDELNYPEIRTLKNDIREVLENHSFSMAEFLNFAENLGQIGIADAGMIFRIFQDFDDFLIRFLVDGGDERGEIAGE